MTAPDTAPQQTRQTTRRLGLVQATGLVMGTILGAAMFSLPDAPESFGRGPFLMAGAALALGIPVYLSRRQHRCRPAQVPPLPAR